LVQAPAPATLQDPDTLLPLSEAADRSEDIRALTARYPGQPAACLESRTEWHTRIVGLENSHVKATLLHREFRRLVVFDPERQEWSSVSIDVPAENELIAAAFSVLTPDGRYRTFGMGSLKRIRSGDGTAAFRFALPEVAPGSVIGVSYVVREADGLAESLSGFQAPLQMTIPCRRARFDLLLPSAWKIVVKRPLPNPPLPVKTSETWGTTTRTWEAEDLPAITNEPFSPYFQEMAATVEVDVTDASIDLPRLRPIEYHKPKEWESLAKEFKRYAIADNPLFSSRVAEQTRILMAGAASERLKLEAVVLWVQDNIRCADWATIHRAGLENANFAEILKQGMGGAGQVNGLAMEMLSRAGLECRYLLIHLAQQGSFDPEYHSYRELGYPGLLVKADGREYVVFPVQQHLPIDLVPECFLGQPALAIDRKGKSEFITIPLGNQATNETADTCKVTLRPDGKALVEETCSLRGAPALALRTELWDLADAEAGRFLMRRRGCPGGKAVLGSHEITGLKDHTVPLIFRMAYEVDGLLSESGDTRVFDPGRLFDPAPGIQATETKLERQNPIRIYFDQTLKKAVTLAYPETWTLLQKPADSAVTTAFGGFHGSFDAGPGRLTGERSLELRMASEPKESYPALHALIGRRTRQEITTLVFQAKPAP
jgi:hypothetical protein